MKSIHLSARLEELDGNVWSYYLPVPAEIALQFREKGSIRVVCTFPGDLKVKTGMLPKGEDEYIITIKKELRKKLGIHLGDEISFALEKDDSKYGMDVPKVFQELIDQDEEFSEYFHALTPGKQRNLIYIVANAKREETQVKKAVIIARYLVLVEGKLDFKELNKAFKEWK